MRPHRFLVALAVVAMAGVACASGPDPNAPQDEDLLGIGVPPKVAGLSVAINRKATDRMNKEAAGSNSYVRDATVFEMRDGKELRAVFQVTRLSPDARTDDFDFRRTIASGIGGGSQAPQNLGGVAVYEARQNQQVINTWFEGQFMQVLIVREDETIEGGGTGVNHQQLLLELLSLLPVPANSLTNR